MSKRRFEHEWGQTEADENESGHYTQCITCKVCGGKLGTISWGTKTEALPYPGDECPILVMQYIHDS